MKTGRLIAGLVLAVTVLAGGVLMAQEEQEFTYGIITRIEGNEITLSEYDYEQDLDVNMVYTVNEQTIFENISSIKELQVNDSLDLYFREENGTRIATSILKTTEADQQYWEEQESTQSLEPSRG